MPVNFNLTRVCLLPRNDQQDSVTDFRVQAQVFSFICLFFLILLKCIGIEWIRKIPHSGKCPHMTSLVLFIQVSGRCTYPIWHRTAMLVLFNFYFYLIYPVISLWPWALKHEHLCWKINDGFSHKWYGEKSSFCWLLGFLLLCCSCFQSLLMWAVLWQRYQEGCALNTDPQFRAEARGSHSLSGQLNFVSSN